MPLRDRVFWVTVFLAGLVGFGLVESARLKSLAAATAVSTVDTDTAPGDKSLPDFTVYDDTDEKKQAFFSFMLPLVEKENARIASLRKKLLKLSAKSGNLNDKEQRWLLGLARDYRVVVSHNKEKVLGEKWLIEDLLLRVDQVPPSLALAQAANESAWGTSRFAEKGNNLFGQWCFKKGCGLVPTRRVSGASHEVARFKSPFHSVQRYIHNLNTNFAYREFRRWRAEQRDNAKPLRGELAAATLTRYSKRGEAYIDELQSMIRVNELEQYDTI